MKKHARRPDYSKLYPDVDIDPEVLEYLKKTDIRWKLGTTGVLTTTKVVAT